MLKTRVEKRCGLETIFGRFVVDVGAIGGSKGVKMDEKMIPKNHEKIGGQKMGLF